MGGGKKGVRRDDRGRRWAACGRKGIQKRRHTPCDAVDNNRATLKMMAAKRAAMALTFRIEKKRGGGAQQQQTRTVRRASAATAHVHASNLGCVCVCVSVCEREGGENSLG